ncbi:mannitol dehydrogenase family protein [Sphingomonas sp. OK281]|uniref:mannitol dehydrogenase family protein n=1 Tax=Sphingomonas sp. OK281 TaxID=1881067 RepID=UPI0008EFF205|nr:mannitol dehydrogenase family protein [Sphingomonas sp. OK281]SFN71564.1 fructuronate reductase [Sphingomonas sp. OK281]
MRLSRATRSHVSADVGQPAIGADGASRRVRRIVHLGLGAFHRAHQAVYTQDAVTPDDDWRITGVSLRSPQVRDMLAPQDGLYTVTERSNGTTATRLISVIDTVLVAAENPAAVIDALAAHDTHVVTLTVTEKGYYRHPATGRLLIDDPAIAHDLGDGVPRTIYGYLAAALERRRATGAGGLTLVSCDNLSGNGTLLMRLLGEFLGHRDAALAGWTRDHVAAPDTMVDRIVPAATPANRATIAAAIGVDDAAALLTEPFRQWVIEDRFAGPRPRWEIAGAQIVQDVAPFELAKLRLLNASHSTLAYAGLQLGHAFVHEAVADPDLRAFVLAQMTEEAVPSLRPAPGLDPTAYIAALLDRFANADLHHRLDQIAVDGSQKLPQRWIATIEARLERGLDSPRHVMSLAAWIAYTADAPDIADDPMAARYAAIWAAIQAAIRAGAGGDPGEVVDRFVGELGILSPVVRDDRATVTVLAEAVALWQTDGPRAALRAAIQEPAR